MGDSRVLLQLSTRQIYLIFGFLCLTLATVTAIQLASGREPEAGFGAMAVFEVILFELIIGLLVVPVFFSAQNRWRKHLPAIFAAGLYVWFALASLFEVHDQIPLGETQIDVLMVALWFACGGLVLIQVLSQTQSRLAITTLLIAFSLQLALTVFDFTDDFLLQEPVAASVDTLETSLFALMLVFYAMSLVVSLTSDAPATDIGEALSKALFKAEYGKIGAAAAIGFTNVQFALWRPFNPNKSFVDFYAWQISRKLDKGRAHRTLGARQFDRDNLFAQAPKHDPSTLDKRKPDLLIDHLIALGLKPRHALVDYGCGSLRVGRHLIDYLEPGNYWGLDVTHRFFRDGLELLGDEIITEKNPRCRVINPQTLAEVRKHRPDFIASIAVLKHVPMDELDAYFDNLCGLMNSATTLMVTFSESASEARISGKSWSWSKPRIIDLIQQRCPNHTVETSMERPQNARNGIELTYCVLVARPT